MNKFKKQISITILGVFVIGSIAFKTSFFEIAKQLEIYTAMFKELNMYYIDEINPAELNEVAIKSMLKSLDPYTNFYDEQGVEDVYISRSGEYGGIGAYTRLKEKHLYILEPYKESPAAQSGLKAGDEILEIDDIVVKDYKDKSVGNLLRGTPNTIVKLKILRQKKELQIDVNRAKIEINPVPFYSMIDDEVGYIAFIKFNKKASKEVKKAFLALKEQGMKKLILDLRGNPGGLLREAISITNIFIPKGKEVVTTKAKVKKWSKTYKTKREPLDLEIPLVILINGRSASASEIVSGALQDYDRAVILGERSFGKGLVQQYRELAYGTQMKLTISKYYIPSGRCIQKLDYTNRDKDGNVPEFSDTKINAFTTKNGREVFDGGGVYPDVKTNKKSTSDLTKQLYRSTAVFNFVTHYYYTHKTLKPANQFEVEPSIYNTFKTYLKNHNSEFETTAEKEFSKSLKIAEKEGYNKEIESAYNTFKAAVVSKKIQQLDENKHEIVNYLTEEIIKRYYYREGVYQQKLAFDSLIVEATTLLNNNKEYHSILK